MKLWKCPSCKAQVYGPDQLDTECPECEDAYLRPCIFDEVTSQ